MKRRDQKLNEWIRCVELIGCSAGRHGDCWEVQRETVCRVLSRDECVFWCFTVGAWWSGRCAGHFFSGPSVSAELKPFRSEYWWMCSICCFSLVRSSGSCWASGPMTLVVRASTESSAASCHFNRELCWYFLCRRRRSALFSCRGSISSSWWTSETSTSQLIFVFIIDPLPSVRCVPLKLRALVKVSQILWWKNQYHFSRNTRHSGTWSCSGPGHSTGLKPGSGPSPAQVSVLVRFCSEPWPASVSGKLHINPAPGPSPGFCLGPGLGIGLVRQHPPVLDLVLVLALVQNHSVLGPTVALLLMSWFWTRAQTYWVSVSSPDTVCRHHGNLPLSVGGAVWLKSSLNVWIIDQIQPEKTLLLLCNVSLWRLLIGPE